MVISGDDSTERVNIAPLDNMPMIEKVHENKHLTLSPMLPKRYSSTQRAEIRAQETAILRGTIKS